MTRTWVRVALVLLIASAGAAYGAKLPDWVERLSQSTPPIEPGVHEIDSRILFSETRVDVQPDGTFHLRARRAVQALTPQADEVGLGYFHFDDRTEIRKTRAWHLSPERARVKKSKFATLDLSPNDLYLSDGKTRFVRVDGIERGSVVFFEFEAVEQPYQPVFQMLFVEDAPADVIRLETHVPDGWTTRHTWLRQEGPEPAVSGGVTTWELRDVGAPKYEPLGGQGINSAPFLVVGFTPPEDAELRLTPMESWTDLAAWYERIAEGRDAVTPEIEVLSGEVGTQSGFFPGVRSTGAYVRDKVRYVYKGIGIGGYQPHAAGEVLENLYGDCKDKGTLLRSMLAAQGVTSYPVLVNVTLADTVSEEIPSLGAFDHFIVGVPVPEDEPVPEHFTAAMIDAGGLGKLLIVDTTNEYASVGYLPTYLGGKTGFVIAGPQSTLVEIPADDPTAHRIEKRCDAEIQPDLSVKVELETVRYGGPAEDARHRYRQSIKDYRDASEEWLHERWPEATLEELEVVDETDTGAFAVSVSMQFPAPDNPGTGDLLEIFPGAFDDLPRVNLNRRETAVRYDNAMSIRYEGRIRNLPSRAAVPTARELTGEGWSVTTSFDLDEDTLNGTLEMTLSRLRFEPEEFEELKDFWKSIRRAASPAIGLSE